MHRIPFRPRDLRIGHRLAAGFLLCGLVVGAGAAVGLAAVAEGDAKQAEVDRVVAAAQICDDLLININDITGWQGLYLADVPAFGLESALDEESYNRSGYLASKATIERLFAEYDDSALTEGEREILDRTEADFQQLFAEDDEIVALLREQGTAAFPEIMTSINGGEAGEAWTATYEEMGALRRSTDERVADLRAERDRLEDAVLVRMSLALGLAGAVAVAVCVLVTRSVVRPVARAVDALETIAQGRLDVRLDDGARDEVGRLGRALDTTAASVGAVLSDLDRTAVELAEGSERLARVARDMSASATESHTQVGVVSTGADQVSQHVQSVAAGTDQMSASIREIAQQATSAAGVATSAVEAADVTTRTVARLGESSREIGDVVKVISTIAGQTNLLALNATIEAARAGEAGKGFAVVASEVKALSQETARATDDIGRRIEAIQADTRDAVAAIAEISAVIDRINDSQVTIAAAVEEQTATTDEMSRSVQEAATGAAGIAEHVVGVARTASGTQDAAGTTQRTAAELAELSGRVRALVGGFRF